MEKDLCLVDKIEKILPVVFNGNCYLRSVEFNAIVGNLLFNDLMFTRKSFHDAVDYLVSSGKLKYCKENFTYSL